MKNSLALTIFFLSALLLSNRCSSPGDKYDIKFVLQIDEADIIRDLAANSRDTTFLKAIALARQKQINSQKAFVELFGEVFSEIDPDARLASIFATRDRRHLIDFNSTNDEVIKVITDEYQKSIDITNDVLLQRIDNFGIKKSKRHLEIIDNKIHITIKSLTEDNDGTRLARIRNLLTTPGQIEFWETYENSEIFPYLQNVNKMLRESLDQEVVLKDSQSKITENYINPAENENGEQELSLLDQLEEDNIAENTTDNTHNEFITENPLFGILQPNVTSQGSFVPGAGIGFTHYNDRDKIDEYLQNEHVKDILPGDVRFLWAMNPFDENEDYYMLYAIRVTGRNDRAPLDGSVITNASVDFDKASGSANILMEMNSDGARIWSRLTRENIDKAIAIVFDGNVVSAPTVSEEIPIGRSTISGNFSYTDAEDLANILNSMGGRKIAGKLKIEMEQIVKAE